MKRPVYKLLPIFLLTVVFPFIAAAKVVSPSDAMKFAADFIQRQPALQAGIKSGATLSLAWDSRALDGDVSIASAADPAFYVYEFNDGRGFVVVSAEDAVVPVLGYSLENPVGDPDEMPDNVRSWLRNIVNAIEYVRSNNIAQTDEVRKKWTRSAAGNAVILYETASWDQYEPFNRQCPRQNGAPTLTGCIATATSIVMRYHEWPDRGVGSSKAYTTNTYGVRVPSRNFDHEYHWENMPLGNSDFTEEQANEIAALIADVGAAYELDYSQYVTWGYLDPNIRNVSRAFKYNTSAKYVEKRKYSETEWMELIKKELAVSKGPVIFRGDNIEGNDGHIFVIDGYTDKNFFHVNWGWSANFNGYFTINDLTPGSSDYTYGQGMIVGFYTENKPVSKNSFRFDKEKEQIIVEYCNGLSAELLLDNQIVATGVKIEGNVMTVSFDKLAKGKSYMIRLKDKSGKVVKEMTFDIDFI